MKTVRLNAQKSIYSASATLAVCAELGLLTGAAVGLLGSWRLAPLVAWIAGAGSYAAYTWLHVLRYPAPLVKQHALREDPSQVNADLVLVLASLASLAAVGLVVAEGGQHGLAFAGRAVLCILSVVVSWTAVHTIYALRYAEQYYRRSGESIEFAGTSEPTYYDFAYLAFTIGMTYQVSDTTVSGAGLRRTVLKHAMLSYLFGSIFIATIVNLIAGLGH